MLMTPQALLLLAEWTPYTSRSDAGNVGRGEEVFKHGFGRSWKY
jgi:hypothetical protein